MEYIEPAWLTKKRAQKSLQNAENKIRITVGEEEFRNRLEKRLNLIRNIALESDTEDEDPHDHHSEQEFEDEAEDGECDYQEAWGQTWTSSVEEEQEKIIEIEENVPGISFPQRLEKLKRPRRARSLPPLMNSITNKFSSWFSGMAYLMHA